MFADVHADDSSTLVLLLQDHSALPSEHDFLMDKETRRTLAENVKRLREAEGWAQVKLAQKAGIAQTAVSYVERPDKKSPTLDTICALAGAFGVPAWTLLIPSDNLDPSHMNDLNGIVETYTHLPSEGQDQVRRVAESESRYAKTG